LRRLTVLLALVGSLVIAVPAIAAPDHDLSMAAKLERLNQEVGAHEVTRPPRRNEDIERAGRKALREKGDVRLYGLWRVLYAYKSNQVRKGFDVWAERTREVARRENDSNLASLVDLLSLAYRHETEGFRTISDADWQRFLNSPSRDIHMMAGVERVRDQGQTGRWAEAARLAADLYIEAEKRGDIARPLLAEIHQVHSYTLSDIGDKEGALDHMAQAARLDERDAFYMRKIERAYDIAYTAVEVGELDAAERFAALHNRMTAADGDPDLRSWDRFLCTIVAEGRDDPRRVLDCIAPIAAELKQPSSRLEVLMLHKRARAEALLGDPVAARADLTVLRRMPPTMAAPDLQLERFVEAYIDRGEGRLESAFDKLEAWGRIDRKATAGAHVRGVAEMSAALESELRVKRDESRRLAAEVALNRRLAQAWGVIAALLAVLGAGGIALVIYQRLISVRLREAQERAEEANQAKSSFLAVMSHELRTPLNGMLGLAQALRGDVRTGEQREQVELILDSGNTLLVLLNDILDLSKIEAGKLEIAPTPGDLVKTCARLIGGYQPTARDKDIVLTFRVEGPTPGLLLFDAVRIRQCLTNLVSNAIKFTNDGAVEVVLSCGPDVASGRQRVRLTVTDTGIGMQPATLAKLFGAFIQADASTTRNFGGTGLGLNITRRLVEMMGGEITVDSRDGEGSVFTIEILVDAVSEPGAVAEPVPDETAEQASFAALQGRRVLVVDDHPINRRVIRLFLTPFECDLVEAENGRMALEALEREPVDIVLMDVNMPVMDGLEATRRLRADPRFANLPVIALTADVMLAQIRTCLDAGADAHVAKPIDLRNLLSEMDRVLSSRSGPAASAPLGELCHH